MYFAVTILKDDCCVNIVNCAKTIKRKKKLLQMEHPTHHPCHKIIFDFFLCGNGLSRHGKSEEKSSGSSNLQI